VTSSLLQERYLYNSNYCCSSRSVGEGRAVFPVDSDVKARPVNLNSNANRNVEHVWPSWQHVLLLVRHREILNNGRGSDQKAGPGWQAMCSSKDSHVNNLVSSVATSASRQICTSWLEKKRARCSFITDIKQQYGRNPRAFPSPQP